MMRTARSLTVSHSIPWVQTLDTDPPLDSDPPDADTPIVDRMTDACENITFTNFLCGR